MAAMTDLARTLTREREALLGSIAWLSESALDRSGMLGEWSIKRALAHLAARERWVVATLPRLLAAGATDAPALANDCATLEAHITCYARLSPTEQVLELERVRETLLALLGALGDEGLTRPRPWQGWAGTVAEYILTMVYHHERQHHIAIRHALGDGTQADEYEPGARLSRAELCLHRGCA
ncbi:MAG TPA: DinB family protein [Ktedonobacterales bacterium]|nr:DinB family protein [Ktedonobacterales bacterium]